MKKLIDEIEKSLEDNILSEEEKKEIRDTLKDSHLKLNTRLKLILQSIRIASNKAEQDNFLEIFDWLKRVSLILGNYEDDYVHNNAYFSHTHDIRQKVIDALKAANQSLDISMFTLSDDLIAAEIIRAKKRGVVVRIITDDGKITDRGSDIFTLKTSGIHVKIDSDQSLMHHKFAIVDSVKVIDGSYNWTRTGAERNNENIIITDNDTIVQAFIKEFERLWPKMKTL